MGFAYQYATGAVHVYAASCVSPLGTGSSNYAGLAGVRSPRDASYVGTCEQYPVVDGGQNWNPWFADQGGNTEPTDWEYQNEWKVIALDLNKFSQDSVSILLTALEQVSLRGSTAKMSVGKLLQGNRLFSSLWLSFGNYGTPAAIPDLPAGEFYPCCRLVSSRYSPLGTRSRTIPLLLRTCPLLNIADNTTVTYSTDEGWFTNLPRPDQRG